VLIYENNSGLDPGSISRDDRYITLTQFVTTSWINQILLDQQTGKTVYINTDSIESRTSSEGFSVDGKYLYYTSDEGGEFSYAGRYEIATGKKEKIYEDKWDVAGVAVSHNGKYRIVYVNVDGSNQLHLFDNETGKELEFPAIKDGGIISTNIS